MKKVYQKPEIEIIEIINDDIITASGVNGLKDGGSNGSGESESFNSLFK